MTRLRGPGGIVGALAGACLLLGGLLWLEWTRVRAPPPVERAVTQIADETVTAVQAPPVPPLAVFAAIVARPLFMPDRRPYVPPPPAPAQQPPQPEPAPPVEVTVHGIVTRGEQRLALVSVGRAEAILRVAPGDELHGWRVEQVDPSGVALARGAERKRFHVFVHDKK